MRIGSTCSPLQWDEAADMMLFGTMCSRRYDSFGVFVAWLYRGEGWSTRARGGVVRGSEPPDVGFVGHHQCESNARGVGYCEKLMACFAWKPYSNIRRAASSCWLCGLWADGFVIEACVVWWVNLVLQRIYVKDVVSRKVLGRLSWAWKCGFQSTCINRYVYIDWYKPTLINRLASIFDFVEWLGS